MIMDKNKSNSKEHSRHKRMGPLEALNFRLELHPELEARLFFAPLIDYQVREILQETKGQPLPPFIEGEPLGVYPGPQPEPPTPPPKVLAALKHSATVHHWNSRIKYLRDCRHGLARWMNYLVLWTGHGKTINTWRKKHGNE
jgi:hypothetical protein